SSKIGLIVFGLLILSVAMRDVSEVPGGCVFSISQNNPPGFTFTAKTRPSRMYWLPIADARCSQSGRSGSGGGVSGWKAVWQAAQETPTRYGRTSSRLTA